MSKAEKYLVLAGQVFTRYSNDRLFRQHIDRPRLLAAYALGLCGAVALRVAARLNTAAAWCLHKSYSHATTAELRAELRVRAQLGQERALNR